MLGGETMARIVVIDRARPHRLHTRCRCREAGAYRIESHGLCHGAAGVPACKKYVAARAAKKGVQQYAVVTRRARAHVCAAMAANTMLEPATIGRVVPARREAASP